MSTPHPAQPGTGACWQVSSFSAFSLSSTKWWAGERGPGFMCVRVEKGETTVTPFIIKNLNGNTDRNKVAFVSVWQHPPVKGPPQLFLSTSGEASLQIANPDKAKARKGRHRLIERPPPSPLVKRLQNFSNRFKTPIFCGSVKKTYLTLLYLTAVFPSICRGFGP